MATEALSGHFAQSAPLCTVCIPHYGGIDLLRACLRSVFSQECPFTFEVIVHDDASTDDSAEMVRQEFPRVRLISSSANVGFCIGCNRMAAAANGEFIVLLNNDAELFPDALATLQREAMRMARPAILGLPQYAADTGQLLDIGRRLDPFLNAVPNTDPMRTDVGMVAGACLWLPLTLWRELGGFPEWFGSIGEDLYLCCRARLAGYPVRALAVSGYRHRVGSTFGGGKLRADQIVTTVRRRALSERNRTFVMAMTYPSPAVQLAMPVHLLALVLEGVALAILQRRLVYLTRIYLPVFRELFRHRAQILDYRKAGMRSRTASLREYFSAFNLAPYKLVMAFRHGHPRFE